MFKKKKKAEEQNPETVMPEAEQTVEVQREKPPKAPKPLPPLPVSDSMAAGLIAIVFAAVGMVMCLNTCKAANPKEKKPKKPKKEKKEKK
jgi:hypothetical protein